jgi:hypothetical protein
VGKKLRIAGLVCVGLVLVLAAGLYALHKCLRYQPQFYREAMAVEAALQRPASDEMLQQATALHNDVEKEGQWQALFTAQQVNGWLAVDLVKNHPDALPPTASDPRVAIEPQRIMLACRKQQDYLGSIVLSLVVEPYLPKPNLLALRICQARAGALPVPLRSVLDGISQAASKQGIHVYWRQAGGDPVVYIEMTPAGDRGDKLVEIHTLRLGEGELYVAGTTKRAATSRRGNQ